MLSTLFGKKEDPESPAIFKDKVYIHSNGKMNACLKLAKTQPEAIFIAWFNETAETYKTFFAQNGIDEARITTVNKINPTILQNHQPVFLEHYPLHAKELELVKDWQLTNIPVFSSMDEPLFKHFGSDKMIPLIKLFGMKESEAIEHSYVTESIIKGQGKIANKVLTEQLAASQAEWMIKNMES
jgi:dihydrofolate reductase